MRVAVPQLPQWFGRSGSPRAWLVAMTALGLTGVTVAAARSTSNPFAVASLSRLGLDARAGSVMNLTLVAEGVIMLELASSFRTRLAVLRRTGGLTLQGERLMVAGFVVAGAALGLTGFFPVQDPGSTVVHNVGGFAAPIALTATLVAAGLLIRGLGRPFQVGSIIAIATTTVLFVEARFAHSLPYPLMELICFGLLGGWLWLFEARLRRLAVFQATAGAGRSLLFHPARRRSSSTSGGMAARIANPDGQITGRARNAANGTVQRRSVTAPQVTTTTASGRRHTSAGGAMPR